MQSLDEGSKDHAFITTAFSEFIQAISQGCGDVTAQRAIVSNFSREHRTIQQMVVRRLILPILEELARCAVEGRFDLRNEDSCRLAAKMLAAVDEQDKALRFI